ncbi:sulfatase-like hydrolase/transferase [Flavonifractor plautii]|nr:sulfatase-like hydrolase/transferase [Flavonifractor plautii]
MERPNIVAIMNESWADFEDYGNLTLSASVTNYIRSLDNAVYGHAYTSVFGAGTSASEFEFLTGNSMAFLPSGSIPYQQYVLGPTASLASILKAEGYSTLAFHPGERASWQRDRAYPGWASTPTSAATTWMCPRPSSTATSATSPTLNRLSGSLSTRRRGSLCSCSTSPSRTTAAIPCRTTRRRSP